MVSNLINNAVEACGESPQIKIHLKADSNQVTILLTDNGKGIPPEVVEKINRGVVVTSNKKSGYGIGLTQVQETVASYRGHMVFESKKDHGTQVVLTFPRVTVPDWMAEAIVLKPNDIVVILDDDTSIHGAWDTHFQSVLKDNPSLRLQHFSEGKEALDYIRTCSLEEKPRLFLLTDYELLKQGIDGLTAIEQSRVERSILVTSHYANPALRERAAMIGTKILPKQMASEVPIRVQSNVGVNVGKQVDLIVVDDDKAFARNLVNFVFGDLEVDTYHRPEDFLNQLSAYSKDTKILLDNQFKNSQFTGLAVAKQLYDQGYEQLYLLSGQDFAVGAVPDYLTVIRKDDIERIRQLI